MVGPQSRERRSGEEITLCSRRQSDSDSAIAHSVRVTVLSELPNFLGIQYRHTNSFFVSLLELRSCSKTRFVRFIWPLRIQFIYQVRVSMVILLFGLIILDFHESYRLYSPC